MGTAALIAANRIPVLLIAAAVDLLIGDPPQLWHPVQGIGALISAAEKGLRRVFRVSPEDIPEKIHEEASRSAFHRRERIAGVLMVLLVLIVSTGAVLLALFLCGFADPLKKEEISVLGIIFEGVLCGRLLALRSLGEAGLSVRDALLADDVGGARKAVSMIVGRDTERLDEEGIAKAAIETVAENTSDGVTAPLFYMFLFGGAGGIFYKAVNTMDSMTGYKNERYRYFGTAAAKLDDLMNYLPSRLTALFMIAACVIPFRSRTEGRPVSEEETVPGTGTAPKAATVRLPDVGEAFRIWLRDRRKSPSPNSAQTESVCAGALHLRLLGDTWYFGELHHKEEIGNGDHPAGAEDITRSVVLLYRTSFLMFAAGMTILFLLAKRMFL